MNEAERRAALDQAIVDALIHVSRIIDIFAVHLNELESARRLRDTIANVRTIYETEPDAPAEQAERCPHSPNTCPEGCPCRLSCCFYSTGAVSTDAAAPAATEAGA